MKIHAQRQKHDCGVAALASLLGTSYEEMHVAALAVYEAFAKGEGLSIAALMSMAELSGRPLVKRHWRHVVLSQHTGVLGVNWDRSVWSIRGGKGHWVVLRAGAIIDPANPGRHVATRYLASMKGRAGTLLQLKEPA